MHPLNYVVDSNCMPDIVATPTVFDDCALCCTWGGEAREDNSCHSLIDRFEINQSQFKNYPEFFILEDPRVCRFILLQALVPTRRLLSVIPS